MRANSARSSGAIYPENPPGDKADAGAEQIAAVERNFRAAIDALGVVQRERLEEVQRHVGALGARLDDVHLGLGEREREDLRITGDAIRWQLGGLALAVFGTLLGAVPNLFA